LNPDEPSIAYASIQQMWDFYAHVTGISQTDAIYQHDLKAAYYSGFAALLAMLEPLSDLHTDDIEDRIEHWHQELAFNMRRHLRGPVQGP
jgi:hypothetical protein